ncbi:hypothetical protein GBAR_LOCUS11908, partial [Geodia barretti]
MHISRSSPSLAVGGRMFKSSRTLAALLLLQLTCPIPGWTGAVSESTSASTELCSSPATEACINVLIE